MLMRATRGSVVLLCLLLSACSSVNRTPPVPQLSIPYSNLYPVYDLVLEDIAFIADLDDTASTKFCSLAIVSGSTMSMEEVNRLSECRAKHTCFPVPAEGYMPARNVSVYVGPKIVPGFTPEQLRALFTSALSGVGNFKLHSSTKHSLRGTQYIVRAELSEFNLLSDENTRGFGGMGVGPMSILQVVSVSKREVTGFVRFDVRVLESEGGRVVSAFSVAGSATDAYVDENFFSGSISETQGFARGIMQQASRAALNEAAKRILDELKPST